MNSNMRYDIGLLVLRVGAGALMSIGHGWGKLVGFSEMVPHFPDPIGVGSTAGLVLTVFAEFFCSIAVAFGVVTRLAAIPLVVTMCVAVFLVHAQDPFDKKELAMLYLVPFITLMFTGPGKLSVDGLLGRN